MHPNRIPTLPRINQQVFLVTVAVANKSTHGTVIGQLVHIDDSVSTEPVCELYCNANGDISVGVEQTRAGNNEVFTSLGNIPIGTVLNYELQYSANLNLLKVAINGVFQTLSTLEGDAPTSYFKTGSYKQGSTPSDVHFFSVSVPH
ncbi:hypothetical protein D9757_004493 [Collybiopsis confluens]|uniref:Alginate lyase 2 domain-containing protein n=1 Tax=Collybiopsis confluens TaxID=2823264 RepID=A0A8H5HWJ1_9AGAR|nr:hypothetical protein D9757_004493 [Collybiopsis confluens]